MHLWLILGLLSSFGHSKFYDFSPETSPNYINPAIPVLYDIPETQVRLIPNTTTTSYWTCSFVTASNGHQYLVLGHNMYIAGIVTVRSSVLDVTTRDYYATYLYTEPASEYVVDGRLQADVKHLGLDGITTDSISTMRTWSTDPRITYDFTYNATSRVLLNGGTGNFQFAGESCSEWALPAAATPGTFTVNGTDLTVDSTQSFTWYDRQFGGGTLTGNYTWFLVVIPSTSIRASIWAIDDTGRNTNTRLATFRFANGTSTVRPFTLYPSADDQYVASSGVSYATSWNVVFDGGESMQIKSVRADQVTYNETSSATAAYEGFSEIEYNIFGIQGSGFGLAEQVNL